MSDDLQNTAAALTVLTDSPDLVTEAVRGLHEDGSCWARVVNASRLHDAVTEEDSPVAVQNPVVGLPLDPEDAQALMDESGRVTVLVEIGQQAYLEGYACYVQSAGEDHWDRLHALIFSFGLPENCADEIVGGG